MVVSYLSKSAGFYSQFFFLVNHYMHCKKHNLNFVVCSDNWLFKYKNGWEDYFMNVDINNGQETNLSLGHHQQIGDFTINEYKNAIYGIYMYNEVIAQKIKEIKMMLNLTTEYDAIFIRRGDKLSGESNFLCAENYVDVLLNKNPNCTSIFVQTDDYNSYIEIKTYIERKKLNIRVFTICKENLKGGMIIFECNKSGIEWAVNEHHINKQYIGTVIENLRNIVPIDKLSNKEIYQHTIDMLAGIDIVLSANIVICEYSSNVSRFLKLAKKNSDSVFDVNNPDKDINWNKTTCPAFELSFL